LEAGVVSPVATSLRVTPQGVRADRVLGAGRGIVLERLVLRGAATAVARDDQSVAVVSGAAEVEKRNGLRLGVAGLPAMVGPTGWTASREQAAASNTAAEDGSRMGRDVRMDFLREPLENGFGRRGKGERRRARNVCISKILRMLAAAQIHRRPPCAAAFHLPGW
jgi:hypothetical protein